MLLSYMFATVFNQYACGLMKFIANEENNASLIIAHTKELLKKMKSLKNDKKKRIKFLLLGYDELVESRKIHGAKVDIGEVVDRFWDESAESFDWRSAIAFLEGSESFCLSEKSTKLIFCESKTLRKRSF